MNQLMNLNKDVTMTSLEVVKVIKTLKDVDPTATSHTNYIQAIEKYLTSNPKISGNAAAFGNIAIHLSTYADERGTKRKCYILNRNAVLLTISDYSQEVRIALITYIDALEQRLSAQMPGSYLEALKQLVAEVEAREAAEAKALELQETIDESVLMPKYVKAEDYATGTYLTRKDMMLNLFGGMLTNITKVALVLDYYRCRKWLYQGRNGVATEVYDAEEAVDASDRFLQDMVKYGVSSSGNQQWQHPALASTYFRGKGQWA